MKGNVLHLVQAEERGLALPEAARTTHLGPLREELDAEERVDKDDDQPNELKWNIQTGQKTQNKRKVTST